MLPISAGRRSAALPDRAGGIEPVTSGSGAAGGARVTGSFAAGRGSGAWISSGGGSAGDEDSGLALNTSDFVSTGCGAVRTRAGACAVLFSLLLGFHRN